MTTDTEMTAAALIAKRRAVEARRAPLAQKRKLAEQERRQALARNELSRGADRRDLDRLTAEVAALTAQLSDDEAILGEIDRLIVAQQAREQREHEADARRAFAEQLRRKDAALAAVEAAALPLFAAVADLCAVGRDLDRAFVAAGHQSFGLMPSGVAALAVLSRLVGGVDEAGIGWQAWPRAGKSTTPLGASDDTDQEGARR
jgi:chromosome segregation ATPase